MRKLLLIFMVMQLSCNSTSDNDRPKVNKSEVLKKLQEEDPFAFGNYCNERFNYCIGYPLFFLFPLPESGNGDGRVFTDKYGIEVMRVFGKLIPYKNMRPVSLKQQFEQDLQQIRDDDVSGSLHITSKDLSTDFYIIAGYAGNRIFYQKTVQKEHSFAYVILQYDKEEKATFDKIAGKIIRSFN